MEGHMTLRDSSRWSSEERSFIRRALLKNVGIYILLLIACAGLTATRISLSHSNFGKAFAAPARH